MIIIIDNYDSFTYNLVQILSNQGAKMKVVRNDAETVDDLLEQKPAGLVISPGPGRPEGAGVCLDLLRREPQVPLLGVCLGHQSLAMAFGGVVDRAPELMHGKTSLVRHFGQGIFANVPNPFVATRYHSLEVRQDSLPSVFEPVAWSDDDILMGIRHRELPYWGVQFHPESVLTKDGPVLLQNFLKECRAQEGTYASQAS